MNEFKEVKFGWYCPDCKYYIYDENENPCEECLSYPYNDNSIRPVLFEKIEK